jgi:hypothetical protein
MRRLWLILPLCAACNADDLGCRIDVECGAGQVCADGICVPARSLEGGPSLPDGGLGDLAQPGPPDGFSPDALTASCPFNGDGILQRAEIPAMPGLGAYFESTPAGQTATVNLVKQSGGWDFSAVAASDQKVFDGLLSPNGPWWAALFPSASYAQLLDSGTGLLGVYRIEDSALRLLGAVSTTGGVGSTAVAYNPPIDVIRFPLKLGDSWSTTSTVTGTYLGVFFDATETWAMKVDDTGSAKTQAATFSTLRLRVDFEQDYGLSITKQIVYLFLAECYGVVTRVRSQNGETSADFTQASEYRRMAAP